MGERFTRFDPAAQLDNDDAVEIFLADAFETGDGSFIAEVLAIVVRFRGVDEIASKAGMTGAELEESLNARGNMTLASTMAILAALRVTINVQ